jgi:hypothetical protein
MPKKGPWATVPYRQAGLSLVNTRDFYYSPFKTDCWLYYFRLGD